MVTVEARGAALLRRAFGGVPAVAGRPSEKWRVVMLTDIVGSTKVSVELGDEKYVELVSAHHALVRRSLAATRGTEFGDTGDGLWSWFGSLEVSKQPSWQLVKPQGTSQRPPLQTSL